MNAEEHQDPSESLYLYSDHPLLVHRTNKALLHLYQQRFLEDVASWTVGSRHFIKVTVRGLRRICTDWRMLSQDLELGIAGGLVTFVAALASFVVGAVVIRPHWSLFVGSFVLSVIARWRTIIRQGVMANIGRRARRFWPSQINLFQIRGHHFAFGSASLGKLYAPFEQALANFLANAFYSQMAGIGLSTVSLIVKSTDQALAAIALTLPMDLINEDPQKGERLKKWIVRPINKFVSYYSLAGLMAVEKGLPGPPLWWLLNLGQRLLAILGGIISLLTLPKIRVEPTKGMENLERGEDWDGKPLKVQINLYGKVTPDRVVSPFDDCEEDQRGVTSSYLEWMDVQEKVESGELRATNSFLSDTARGAKINRGSLDFKTLNDSELTWLCLKSLDHAPFLTINRETGYNGNPNLVKFYLLYEPTGKIEETALTKPPVTLKSPSYGMVQVQGQHRLGEFWRRSQKHRKAYFFPTFVIELTDPLMEKLVVTPFGGIKNVPFFPPPFLKRSRIGIQNPGLAIRKRFFVNIRDKLNPVLEREIANARANFLSNALPLGGTGIGCGTLSPTHEGHVSLWTQAIRELGLKKLIVFAVPRSRTHDGQIIPIQIRQAILKKAVDGNPKIEVFSPLEGWTVMDNIRRALRQTSTPHVIVCGSDVTSLYLNDPQFPAEMKLAVRQRFDLPLPTRSKLCAHLMNNCDKAGVRNRIPAETDLIEETQPQTPGMEPLQAGQRPVTP